MKVQICPKIYELMKGIMMERIN